MIRVCTIGMNWSGNLHADAYRGEGRAQLAGVCDRDAGLAHAAATRLEVPAYADAAEMLDAQRPDLVSVCAGDGAFAAVKLALERGCHVLCEPPLGRDAAQARELVAAAQAAGRGLAVNFNLRFTPAALRAKRWMDDGRLGTPLFINTSVWWEAETGGDAALWRLALHGFDLMRWLCGDIAQVQCFAVGADSQPGAARLHSRQLASAQANVKFAQNIVGGLTVSRHMSLRHPLARCEVAGTTARLLIDNIYEEISLFPHVEREKTVVTNSIWGGDGLGEYPDTYRCRIRRLLEQLEGGALPEEIEGAGAEAVAAHAAVDAAVSALATGEVTAVTPES